MGASSRSRDVAFKTLDNETIILRSEPEVVDVVEDELRVAFHECGSKDPPLNKRLRDDLLKLRSEAGPDQRYNTPSVPTWASGRVKLEARGLMKQNITHLHIVTKRLLNKCKRRMRKLPLKQAEFATTNSWLVMGKSSCIPRDASQRSRGPQKWALCLSDLPLHIRLTLPMRVERIHDALFVDLRLLHCCQVPLDCVGVLSARVSDELSTRHPVYRDLSTALVVMHVLLGMDCFEGSEEFPGPLFSLELLGGLIRRHI